MLGAGFSHIRAGDEPRTVINSSVASGVNLEGGVPLIDLLFLSNLWELGWSVLFEGQSPLCNVLELLLKEAQWYFHDFAVVGNVKFRRTLLLRRHANPLLHWLGG